MGAGKSTVSDLVARKLRRARIDLDEVITREAGRPIAEIFEQDGEDAFRDMESDALRRLADEAPSVVACGGGVVVRPENRALLRELGTVVYLEVTAGEAIARVGDAQTRPLLAGSAGTLAATALLQARESLYRSVADVVVSTSGRTPTEVAEQVVEAIDAGGGR
jgi:shikimate kinase